MTVTNWNREPPPGFQGFREDLPMTVYTRHLPHWRQDGAAYFVTFRLADSLPQSKLRELEAIKREWAMKSRLGRTDCQSVLQPDNRTDWQSVLQNGESFLSRHVLRENWENFARSLAVKVENWLDEGMGECWLARPEISQVVIDSFHHFDNDHYELGCYVVMPNHVHGVFRPLRPKSLPLEKVLQSRKLRMSLQINAIVERSGALWEEESFDRIIRDEEHLYRCIQYIGATPSKHDCRRIGGEDGFGRHGNRLAGDSTIRPTGTDWQSVTTIKRRTDCQSVPIKRGQTFDFGLDRARFKVTIRDLEATAVPTRCGTDWQSVLQSSVGRIANPSYDPPKPRIGFHQG